MPRVKMITSMEDAPAGSKEIFDAITASRGNVRGPFAALMHSPEVAGRVAHLGTYIRFESTLPPRLKEIAVATVAREAECAYEFAAHAAGRHEAGISDETWQVISSRGDFSALPEDEREVIAYARELVNTHHVSDATYAPAYARFGDKGIAELTATIGYYSLLACVLNGFEVGTPPGGATWVS